MKKLTLLFVAAIAFSCNNTKTTPDESTKETMATDTGNMAAMDYAYTIKKPDNWEMGNPANAATALKGLKAWEDNKLDESVSYFADSVTVKFDGIDKKMSRAELKAFFTEGRNMYKTVKERMEDFESVTSKDKKDEWVTLWYTQIWETPKGVKDSVALINNMQFKVGKIVLIDEYTRKLH